jgi:hypothetical protein
MIKAKVDSSALAFVITGAQSFVFLRTLRFNILDKGLC